MMRTLTVGLCVLALGCEGEATTPPEPVNFAAQVAACKAEGAWVLRYDPTDDAAWAAGQKWSDVIHVHRDGVTLDTVPMWHCDDAPRLTAAWAAPGDCTLHVHHERGPCGSGEWRTSLDLTLTVGHQSAGGQATFVETSSHNARTPGRFAVVGERSAASTVCAQPDVDLPPEVPAVLPAAWTGAVTVVEHAEANGHDGVVLVLDGPETPARIPLPAEHPAVPAVGDPLWLDASHTSGFWPESAFVLRTAEAGPLVAAALDTIPAHLDHGPWARAGLVVALQPTCIPAWLSLDCGELVTFQRVSVRPPDAHAMGAEVGESVVLDAPTLGGPLVLQVRRALTAEQHQCTDQPPGQVSLRLGPEPG